MIKNIPDIKYSLTIFNDMSCVNIFADNSIVIEGIDAYEFYFMLGYTNEYRMIGVEPEQFIDTEYRRATSLQTDADLQLKIYVFLINCSPKFKEKYALLNNGKE